MDQPDLILEKLRRAEAELPPEEHSPNMLNLRAGLEAGSAALDELEASERAREDDGPRATADTAPHLFNNCSRHAQRACWADAHRLPFPACAHLWHLRQLLASCGPQARLTYAPAASKI